MTAIVTSGIDLTKNVFAVHGVDATGKPTLARPNVPRAKLLELIATLPPSLIGMREVSQRTPSKCIALAGQGAKASSMT